MKFSNDLVFVDVETTGLDASSDSIIEIAAIRPFQGEKRDRLDCFVSLIKTATPLGPRITKLTGITNELLDQSGNDAKEVMAEFCGFIGASDLVAHNARFDAGFIQAAIEKHCGHLWRPMNFVCTLQLARDRWPSLPTYRLEELTKSMEVDAHRALGDARRCMTLFYQMHPHLIP